MLPFDTDEDEGAADATVASSVLIVDDEWVVRDIFSRLLEREGDLRVETVDSAESALARLDEKKFDLLITDKNLPGLGGVELIARARERRPALEAMMITGYATAESLLAAMAAGASDYLTKPFDDLKVVRAKIRAALERRTQKVKDRERARTLAKEAQALLEKGRGTNDQSWANLDAAFSAYEVAIRQGGDGRVLVVGAPEAIELLSTAGIQAEGPASTAPGNADVVVIATSYATWRDDAEALLGQTDTDVLLLAGPEADLPELLEALTMHLELVGFGQSHEAGLHRLPVRVRALLMQHAVQRAQAGLSKALETFRAGLA